MSVIAFINALWGGYQVGGGEETNYNAFAEQMGLVYHSWLGTHAAEFEAGSEPAITQLSVALLTRMAGSRGGYTSRFCITDPSQLDKMITVGDLIVVGTGPRGWQHLEYIPPPVNDAAMAFANQSLVNVGGPPGVLKMGQVSGVNALKVDWWPALIAGTTIFHN